MERAMRPALSPATLDALSRALAKTESSGTRDSSAPDLERRRRQREEEERRKVATSGGVLASGRGR
jgi:hypothetical protein